MCQALRLTTNSQGQRHNFDQIWSHKTHNFVSVHISYKSWPNYYP